MPKNTGNVEWITPPRILDVARRIMGDIDVDPATTQFANENFVKAAVYYTKHDDGLNRDNPWNGRVWMNPPYKTGLVLPFCQRFVTELCYGSMTQGMVVINNCTETRHVQLLLEEADVLCLLNKRLSFLAADGSEVKQSMQGQVLMYFGPSMSVAEEEMLMLGAVFRKN